MYESLLIFFLNPPGRLRGLGHFISRLGFALLIAGMYLRIASFTTDLVRGMSVIKTAPATLADVYPGIPTWFIPESFIGFSFVLVIVAAGLYAIWFANKIQRTYYR